MKNYSKQREEILAIVQEMYNHPTAEEIYFLTKQKDPSVSRSTVYRNLGLLVRKGILLQIAISNGPDRYDYIVSRKKHGHVICKNCGKVCDFCYDVELEKLKDSIEKQTKMEVSDCEMMVKGICNSCKELEENLKRRLKNLRKERY